LDAGLSSPYSPDYICVTHSHSDHIANIFYHLYGCKQGQKIKIYTPVQSVNLLDDLIKSTHRATCNIKKSVGEIINELKQTKISNPEEIDKLIDGLNAKVYSTDNNIQGIDQLYEIVPVNNITGVIDLNIKKRNISIEFIECCHEIPSIGFGFIESKQRIKSEYNHLRNPEGSKELSRLRKEGIQINENYNEYPFIYLGDTSEKVLENPELLKYKNIMIECTFIGDDELEQAKKTKHIHFNHLEEFVKSHPEIHFILYHFSQRYKKEEIEKYFAEKKYSNIYCWISQN